MRFDLITATSGVMLIFVWRLSVKVGDLIKLPKGTVRHWDLPTGVALLVEKLPRNDYLENGS